MNKRILFLIFLFAAILTFTFGKANAQTVNTEPSATPEPAFVCPSGYICLPRDTAVKLGEKAAELESVKKQNDALQTALTEQKKLTLDVQTKLAYEQGRNSALEAQAIRDAAIIQAMIPMLRKKKIGIFNIF